MRLDVNTMSGDDYSYELWNKDTNTKINDCILADDETGEYTVHDTYTAEEMLEQYGPKWNVGGLVDGKLKPLPNRFKHDADGFISCIFKKGNIEFRKWDGTEKVNNA